MHVFAIDVLLKFHRFFEYPSLQYFFEAEDIQLLLRSTKFSMYKGGIHQNLCANYYFEKFTCTARAWRSRARYARAVREGRRDEQTERFRL
jgi:hypothetical protein